MRLVGLVLLFFLFTSFLLGCEKDMPTHVSYYCAANGETYVDQLDYQIYCFDKDSVLEQNVQLWESRKEVNCKYENLSFSGFYIPDSGHFNMHIKSFENDSLFKDTLLVNFHRGDELLWTRNYLDWRILCEVHTRDWHVFNIRWFDFPDSTLNKLYSNNECQDSTAISVVEYIVEKCVEWSGH